MNWIANQFAGMRRAIPGWSKREAEIDALTAENANLDAKNANLDAKNSSLAYEINRLEAMATESDRLRGQIASLQADNAALQADKDSFLARILGRLTILDSKLTDIGGCASGPGSSATATFYLDLLEDSLVGNISGDPADGPWSEPGYDAETRLIGRDWPSHAETMIGVARMRNLRELTLNVLRDGIPGDLLEAGVWRGGACIYMRGILKAHGIADRTVWVADSFRGLPPPNPGDYPADAGDTHHTMRELNVPIETVRANFQKYRLLDDRVRFLEGWFKDTLPKAPIQRLALLRLDGDMYESTMDTLTALYDKVASGGFIIVDDYDLPGCRKATDDFRSTRVIREALVEVDGAAVFWRKP